MDEKSTPKPIEKDDRAEGNSEGRPEDLSTKLDPDFLPPDTEPPTRKKAREHPEETGS